MIIAKCRICKRTFNVGCTLEQYDSWQSGVLIQKAMPDVSPDLRELLVSGICGGCFDRMFPGGEL